MAKRIVKKMDDKGMQEHWKMHKKMMGWKMLIVGVLVILNAYFNVFNWANFIGLLLVIGGIMKLTMSENCCGK